jgi:cyclic beta-1,2-glucan synthetase
LSILGFSAVRKPGGQLEAPIRAELFSVERLEQHAESLAAAQPISSKPHRGRPLVHRIHDNNAVLTATYRALVRAVHAQQPITPAAEWLLDNFHIVDEQIREIREDLPPGFYRKLPKLADGPLQGYPRVFGIAWALVAHTDSAFDLEKLTRFVTAYQRVQPLTTGELWALAITLRITLIENLRRLAEAIGARHSARQQANDVADAILGRGANAPQPAGTLLIRLDQAAWSPSFAVQLSLRLRDLDPDATPALRWLNARLAADGVATDELIHQEVQRQSAANVTVRNVITSMRLVSTLNWAEFFESVSPLDAIMRRGSHFADMDFSTRDLYRSAIEDLARCSGRDETDVALRAIAAAKGVADTGGDDGHESDPGYYLIARGRRAFEKELGCRLRLTTLLFRLNSDLGVMSYIAMIAVVTAIVLSLALLALRWGGADGQILIGLAIVGLIPASDVAIAFVNRMITRHLGAMRLPGLELREGVPSHLRTIVVVPTMLTDIASIEAQIERLEVHHLSSPGDDLVFALLSDWSDAVNETIAGDEALANAAAAGIARLNTIYGPASDGPRFVLLHRRRVWNEGEGRWIGWERKRGKLHELNRLLRGATDTTFLPVAGQAPSLPLDIRYVITLDADTRLPIGTARRLIGKIAHPLNQARFDSHTGLVVQGHGILQPRVTPSLPIGAQGSLFERVFSGPNGLDPYALAVSDIYQDLFEAGSYCGKGIYDVDVFAAALEGQIPESSVLSHDLLEGILARSGLVSDIEVVEEFPSRYDVSAARQHRWVRGDWQLLPWIFGYGRKTPDGAPKTRIPLMGRWKLIDNLRRSLSAPAALLALLVGWFQSPATAEIWTGFILLTIATPPFLPAVAGLLPRRAGVSMHNHVRSLRDDLMLGALQCAFLITSLAHQAWLMVDAVLRTLFRLFIRRRRLLQWVAAAQADRDTKFSRRGLLEQFAASAVFAGLLVAALYLTHPRTLGIAVPFALLWTLSPFIARWASLPPAPAGHLSITTTDALALRLIGRRTWRFFEAFVTAEDNRLPPDNFQEDPEPVIAHRTSPTNIGLYLLSVVTARDFGWIGTLDALERLEATLATLHKMEQFRGHLYNWYDTIDLRALEPKYVSSVDSGNLAGHLLTLGEACREMARAPIVNTGWAAGLQDTLDVLREASRIHAAGGRPHGAAISELDNALDEFGALLQSPPSSALDLDATLADLAQKAAALNLIAQGWSDKTAAANDSEVIVWAEALRTAVGAHQRDLEAQAREPLAPGSVAERFHAVATASRHIFNAMEFGFLFDPDRQLLSIGYRADDGSLDSNVYDLLASEARLASFIAIAKGDLPAKHWFRLGRTMTPIDGGSGLISWSGSMFEYLMPSLVMRAPAGSLLEQTNRLAVWRQARYADKLGIPWGMSESEYNVRDIEQTYQYSSFGVPDLGYKRGLGDNIVIAPYASGLGAMINPAAAAQNYRRLADLGARGGYGWYEALDYTRSRLPQGSKFAIVRAYMAHHQAMTLVAIANTLQNGQMRARFHAEPIVKASELLLQERMPREVALARPPPEQAATSEVAAQVLETRRRYSSAHSPRPRTQILSNGRYCAMVTATGSGYSRWRDIAVTRWREDPTCDGWGAYVFLRDVRSGQTWSAGYQPSKAEPDSYDVAFAEDRVEITRSDATLTTTLEVMVSSEDDAEVRRVSITNHGTRPREIELTSYAEISLARQADDLAHPAFAKLFVQTEFEPDLGALLATRRRRSSADPLVWAAHLAVVEGESPGDVQFETDRARFLGRGQTIRSSAMITEGWPLSNTSGAVLDPIFSLRRRVKVPRGGTVRVAFWTMVAATREEVLALADKHHDPMAFDRATALAWTQAQTQLRHLGVSSDEANLFQRLANRILYSNAALRPPSDVITLGLRPASTLWGHGISGDLPIVLVRIEEDSGLDLVRQLLQAHDYLRLKQLAVDLVILNERASSYVQDLQIALEALVRINRSTPSGAGGAQLGSVFMLRADLASSETRDLLQAAARCVLHGDRGSLADQLDRSRDLKPAYGPAPRATPAAASARERVQTPAQLEFFNGLGGFTNEGREYLTLLQGDAHTPAPWINVVSNASFGFQVSADGAGFTWSVNSQQNQLTPWSNDPVGDAPGEILYLRDEETGEIWGPTALPIREKTSSYTVRHGQGYSRFEHSAHGISLELLQFVPLDDSIKISRLKIVNQSGRQRRLSITAYVEWVLGQNRTATAPYITTEIDPATGAIFAQNPWSGPFGARVAFVDLNGRQTAGTCDRTEFLGRDGALDWPHALAIGAALSNRSGAGLDPCAALQAHVQLDAAGSTEIVVFLGQAATKPEAQALVAKYRQADLDAVFANVNRRWDDMLGTVQVKTPDRALDILLNRWLPYQTLACRIWARSGFYQASGAYGFRDQLQDVMALCVSRPDIAREHLLRAAGRQFPEGDVQHWWLPESGSGIRTRVSDDRGWLAYVVAHYVEVTGDLAVLDEVVPFIDGPGIKAGERDAFFLPTTSETTASLFEHCALGLDTSLAVGSHGLPLMGAGDWNDGMDQIGEGGQGESVWLGWFLYSTLDSFSNLAERYGDAPHAMAWRKAGAGLKEALERDGWDGDWYRRAYFDDGTPLGSASSIECRIDSIAQSWAVISGAADPARAKRAMAALDKYLVRPDEKLSLLFTPPFDNPVHDPGYIKGYPPGVRENGGQYTHGAVWAALAAAMQGDGDKAGEWLSMLNPIRHGDSPTGVHRYKVEPYVICADIYSEAPNVGRGGWTWYTGSAGWMYRVAVERLLGFRVQGANLTIDPCIPRGWPGFQITYRYRSAVYEIGVENPNEVCRGILMIKLDGKPLGGGQGVLIPLLDDDGAHHVVDVVLGTDVRLTWPKK